MVSPMKALGTYLAKVVQNNPKIFRIFSPDELSSNKLDSVLEVTLRQFEGRINKEDASQVRHEGRVLEMLSEHTLQGWLQGYLLTGRHGIFPSYEAFLGIVGTMMDQYSKFIKMSMEVDWRPAVPSLNYIASSTLWRQEHNGFSHQNPGFINTLLNKKSGINRIYFPPDGNCMNFVMNSCLKSRNKINLIFGAKHETPQWLDVSQAAEHCTNGASIWKWASTNNGVDPDVVLVAVGVETTVEVMAAANLLKKDLPDLRVRVVNVVDLMVFLTSNEHPHGWGDPHFDAVFTRDRPVVINFHGYPSAFKQLLFGRSNSIRAGDRMIPRFYIHGYIEEGTTTTPFDMAVSNQTSRFHIALEALKQGELFNPKVTVAAIDAGTKYVRRLKEFAMYIVQHGCDPVDPSRYWETFDVLGETQDANKTHAARAAEGAKKAIDSVVERVVKAVQTK
jgi:xylulose-5-phosphate/fructose-6-phosphate phosphoketolase